MQVSSGRIPTARRLQEKEISWLRNRTSKRRRSAVVLNDNSGSSSDGYWRPSSKARAAFQQHRRSRRRNPPKTIFGVNRDRITTACKGCPRSWKRMPVMAYAASVWNSLPSCYTKRSTPPDWFCGFHNLSRRGFLVPQTTGTKCSRLFRWYVRTNWVLRKFLPQDHVLSHTAPCAGRIVLPAFKNRLPVRVICRMLRTSVRLLELLRY